MPQITHHTEETIVKALHRLIANCSTCRVAVSYCGAAAYKFFPDAPASRPADLRIIVDASDSSVRRGLTNPKGLEGLLGLTGQLRSLAGLHTKAFIFDDAAAIVGSINLSESSITQQYQLALEVSNPELVGQLIAWFDEGIWGQGKNIDSARLRYLKEIWPGSELQVPATKTKGKLPEWRGEEPQPTLEPSDFSIGISKHDLDGLLTEFGRNVCKYSKKGESCLQKSRVIESDYKRLSSDFQQLMAYRDSWTTKDLSAIFDLAYTNGKAAKMRKPLFIEQSPTAVARSLTFLVDGPGDPYVRFEKLLASKGGYKLHGLGEPGVNFLLHLWNPANFPVINGPVVEAFKILNVKFHRRASKRAGQGYKDRTAVIRELAKRTGLQTFALTDHFLDGLGKGHIGSPS